MSQCSFIAGRSDDEDGAVAPEPGGPMEVPARGSRMAPDSLKRIGFLDRPFSSGTSIGEGHPISQTGHSAGWYRSALL